MITEATKNNIWAFIVYKGEDKPIPFRVWSSPTAPRDITGYTFEVTGKIALGDVTETMMFKLDNNHFTVLDGAKGLAYFLIPKDTLLALDAGQYITQITIIKGDGSISKSHMFTVRIQDAV
jgi:hypothetical protein